MNHTVQIVNYFSQAHTLKNTFHLQSDTLFFCVRCTCYMFGFISNHPEEVQYIMYKLILFYAASSVAVWSCVVTQKLCRTIKLNSIYTIYMYTKLYNNSYIETFASFQFSCWLPCFFFNPQTKLQILFLVSWIYFLLNFMAPFHYKVLCVAQRHGECVNICFFRRVCKIAKSEC